MYTVTTLTVSVRLLVKLHTSYLNRSSIHSPDQKFGVLRIALYISSDNASRMSSINIHMFSAILPGIIANGIDNNSHDSIIGTNIIPSIVGCNIVEINSRMDQFSFLPNLNAAITTASCTEYAAT